LQPQNGGIVMVNFYPGFVNCQNPDKATLEDVVGTLTKYFLWWGTLVKLFIVT